MSVRSHTPFQPGADPLKKASPGDAFRTPITPIRLGRNTPGGMLAVFILIGFLVVAIAVFA